MMATASAQAHEVSRELQTTANPDDEPFWVERVLRWVRSDGWVEATTTDLEAAARSWPAAFVVSRAAIRAKLAEAAELVVLRDGQGVFGFVATSFVHLLPRTGLTFRYIEGTIVHRERGGRRKFDRLMSELVRADIEVLHTQSPAMARALAGRSPGGVFPAVGAGLRLGDDLRADLECLFKAIGRPHDCCPITGVVPDLYGTCLYGQWPIPGVAFEGGFEHLIEHPSSGIVVVGFGDRRGAARCLEAIAPEGGRP